LSDFAMAYSLTQPRAEQIARIEEGLEYAVFAALQERLGVSTQRLADVLRMSSATLHRRKAEGRFTPEESDRLYRLLALVELAERIIGEAADAQSWLTAPSADLGGAIPLEYARTAPGLEAVQVLLYQIAEGIVI
jgi:putative toxin-antitoxin system antitoxin component (TIGR02293 family)